VAYAALRFLKKKGLLEVPHGPALQSAAADRWRLGAQRR